MGTECTCAEFAPISLFPLSVISLGLLLVVLVAAVGSGERLLLGSEAAALRGVAGPAAEEEAAAGTATGKGTGGGGDACVSLELGSLSSEMCLGTGVAVSLVSVLDEKFKSDGDREGPAVRNRRRKFILVL